LDYNRDVMLLISQKHVLNSADYELVVQRNMIFIGRLFHFDKIKSTYLGEG